MPRDRTFRVVVTVPANTPAGTLLTERNVQIEFDPVAGPQPAPITVPTNVTWIIYDIFLAAAPSIDLMVIFRKNEQDFSAPIGPLSLFRQDLQLAKMTLQEAFGYEGGARLGIRAVTRAAAGTSAVTVEFFLKVWELP